jgi:hypothetical protein
MSTVIHYSRFDTIATDEFFKQRHHLPAPYGCSVFKIPFQLPECVDYHLATLPMSPLLATQPWTPKRIFEMGSIIVLMATPNIEFQRLRNRWDYRIPITPLAIRQ